MKNDFKMYVKNSFVQGKTKEIDLIKNLDRNRPSNES